ncbi:MAG: hypothetical protein P8J87_20650, partial [Verrucomicrobiales bacterium]|nr:hypothetical protein [Verrucomicrobiales bacterium]
LAVAGGLLLLSGCGDRVTRVEYDVVKKEADGLKARVEELTERSALELGDLESQLGEQSGERDRLEGEAEVLKQQLEEAKKELETLKGEFEDYQRNYRVGVRAEAPGRKFERVVVSGEEEEVFTGVVIREIDPVRIRVMHDAGATTIHLANLGEALQAELGFDLQEASAFLEAEAKAAEPEVLTKEEKNERARDEFAKERMKNQAAWDKKYAEAQRLKKKMTEVAARQKAVVAALNRYFSRTRTPAGSSLKNVNRLKLERIKLDRQYEELKIQHYQLMK